MEDFCALLEYDQHVYHVLILLLTDAFLKTVF
jgi:hypothetical protein